MLLAPDHPTYKVLVQPTLEYATCTWSPHIQGTRPTNTGVCYLHLVTPHTRYSSNQHWSMLLAPGHPTYKVLVQPTLEYATCIWSPHIQGTRPTNTKMCYLHLVTPHTRYSSNQHWSILLASGHPTYKVLVQPTLKCATCTWSPHIQGTHPTNTGVCYLHLVTPHTRYSSNQHSSMLLAPGHLTYNDLSNRRLSRLLAPGHPTYEVLVQPMLENATCAWPPHIRGTRPSNTLVYQHSFCLLYPNVEFALWPSLHQFVYHHFHQHSLYDCSIPMWNSSPKKQSLHQRQKHFRKAPSKLLSHCRNPFLP